MNENAQGGRPSKFRNRRSVTIYLENEVVEELRYIAGREAMSSYIRELINTDISKKRSEEELID